MTYSGTNTELKHLSPVGCKETLHAESLDDALIFPSLKSSKVIHCALTDPTKTACHETIEKFTILNIELRTKY